jgi:hypothetical protein
MGTVALLAEPQAAFVEEIQGTHWLVFHYSPVSLFSLKLSRATSTAGKTLLIPTPYSIKMAFVDAALRHRLTDNPEQLIRGLAKTSLRIGVPQHACVTGIIQSIRQEIPESERKQNPGAPPYRTSIATREFVHYCGLLAVAFEFDHRGAELSALLMRAAPAINYFGKRGSFFQYRDTERLTELDSTFTEPADPMAPAPVWGHRATLDDLGPKASFAALNSFSPTPIERGVHRKFVETMVPLGLHNVGPGFVHYCAPGAIL